jgi:hypothetical protein
MTRLRCAMLRRQRARRLGMATLLAYFRRPLSTQGAR